MSWIFYLLFLPLSTPAAEVPVDALWGKVGREAVLQSDLLRFQEVSEVLTCAGVLAAPAPEERKKLLDAYIEEELIYLEARSRKISTAGMIPQAVRSIHSRDACKSGWQQLGRRYSRYFRTDSRTREGESLLVRELEKRVLVERFRKTELISDGELWRREVRSRYPVKVYLE